MFSSIPDLKNNRAVIDEIIDAQEELNMCTDLTKTLDIHTSQKLANVPGLNKEYRSSLKERRKTLTVLRDPTYIPKSKFINESKMLQLAFLDKIIEECDDDQNHNRIGDIVERTQSFVDTQVQKIKNDDLKIELEVKKDEDFEYQLAFDQSFYGKDSVNVIKKDQYRIRNKIRSCIGQ